MAARRSRISSNGRGVEKRQGAKTVREGPAPLPSPEVYVPSIDSLDEISGWLGTFRERLRAARGEDGAGVATVVQQLEARYQTRRAELA